jgi:flagellar assembly factor FliW
MKTVAPLNTPPFADGLRGPTAGHESRVVEFPAGIPGFETCRRFVLITSPELAPLSCLQALDPPEASFLAVDPTLLDAGYDLTLREFERARLGAGDEPLLWLAIVTVADNAATANLRAPVVINPRRMLGCQFIRDENEYPVHFPLGRV